MARPVKFNAAPKPASAGARTSFAGVKARVKAARGGPRGGKARGGTPNSGGGGGYTPSNDPIPD
ncbi:MAG TPA: hypothetical protein VD866_08140 [Urbifossiella sp.]|nr:hypothetical protein [Urbifossiella sp.]